MMVQSGEEKHKYLQKSDAKCLICDLELMKFLLKLFQTFVNFDSKFVLNSPKSFSFKKKKRHMIRYVRYFYEDDILNIGPKH